VNHELRDVQVGFRKGRGTSDQIANICWIMEKARELQKNIYFYFIDCAKAFSKSNLNISKFMVHVLLKPGLENLKHYFPSV